MDTFGLNDNKIWVGQGKVSLANDGIIVLYGWKVNVQEQNEIVGELHIPRENFTFPRS